MIEFLMNSNLLNILKTIGLLLLSLTVSNAQDADLDGIPDSLDLLPFENAVGADPDGNNNLPANLSADLIGRWDCEEIVSWTISNVARYGFNDSAGTNDRLESIGNLSLGLDNGGMISKGVIFDSDQDYLAAPATLISGKSKFAISFWYKANTGYVTGTPVTLFTFYHSDAFPSSWVAVQLDQGTISSPGQKISFKQYNDPDWTVLSSNVTAGVQVDDGKWHHICFDKSNQEYKLFLDGIRLVKQALPFNGNFSFGTGGKICFGKWKPEQAVGTPVVGQGRPFRGSMDRLRIYQTSLSDASIVALYNQDSDRDGISDINEKQWTGLQARTPFTWEMIDSDNDGMSDSWELASGLNPQSSADALLDKDEDGYTNLEEFQRGLNPSMAEDTDADGVPDGYEFHHDMNPNFNDSSLDPDDDGLSNLGEFQAGTDPHNFDSDGDLLPDGFEHFASCLNPLIVESYLVGGVSLEAADGDPDNDGLTNLDEYIHGTNPCPGIGPNNGEDSDGDGIPDGDEVSGGSNPGDSQSQPFNPDNYQGATVNDAVLFPTIGNLGVIYTNEAADYYIEGKFGDESGSHSERWALKLAGRRPIQKVNRRFGESDPFKMVLDASLWKMTIDHVATKPGENNTPVDPDYDYTLLVNSTPGFIFVDANSYGLSVADDSELGIVGTFEMDSLPAEYWKGKVGYLIPTRSSSHSENYSGSDAVGPRYRKVALNGRPISDDKPEQEDETELHREETYVDAFDLGLHHDTSFISVALGSSDLVLEANASSHEAIWSTRGGLRPTEELTSPLGAGWTSSLCSYIEVTQTLEANPTDPTSVNVVDEGGRGQRFATNDLQNFQPWPSSRIDKKTYLNELIREGDDLVFYKKYGNKLTYSPCQAWFMYSTDRLSGSKAVVKHTYWRLIKVEDRYGNALSYNYGTSEISLIPIEISADNHPGQVIKITPSSNGRRIDSIKDPKNQTFTFGYETLTIPGGGNYTVLSSVSYPDGTRQSYTYDPFSEPEIVEGKATLHCHVALHTITDRRGNYHTINYIPDRNKSTYSSNGSGRTEFAISEEDMEAQLSPDVMAEAMEKLEELNETPPAGEANVRTIYGIPRLVSSVVLPGGVGTSTFLKTAGTHTFYGKQLTATSGTEITDAANGKTFYDFDGIHGEVVDVDQTFEGDSASISVEWMMYYTSMTVHHGGQPSTAGHLGSETFEFDLASGLSLSRMIDFSGNETSWSFEDALSNGAVMSLADMPNFMSCWADPTLKIDALHRTETYEYGHHRVMTKSVDVHGTTSETTVDTLGRRKDMTVTGPNNVILRKEIFGYTNAAFPAFMTRRTIKAYANLSGKPWEQDLVTEYVPDSRGRVWKEIVNPEGLNLTTIYTYDLNNNRLTVTDPRTNRTTYHYDNLNRIYQIDYPATQTEAGLATSSTYNYFDKNGSKVVEIDENSNWTIYQRDVLGRITAIIRDMEGVAGAGRPGANSYHLVDDSALSDPAVAGGPDIVSSTEFNAVGYPVKKMDARGSSTITIVDSLQRPVHQFAGVPAGSAENLIALSGLAASSRTVTHTEFSYSSAVTIGSTTYDTHPGASGFSAESFKPTIVTRHNAVAELVLPLGEPGPDDSSFTVRMVYDPTYRPLLMAEEYKSGSASRLTTTLYPQPDQGKEPLVSQTEDALGKISQTRTDGLGRIIEIKEAFGTVLESTISNHYTSTGLAWKSVDELLRTTETEFDAAGRPRFVREPDPVTGLVTVNSPVTEKVYDSSGNVTAVIDPREFRTDTMFDARGRAWKTLQPPVTDSTNPSNPVSGVRPTMTKYYDLVGNATLIQDARGSRERRFYDSANRLTATRTNPASGLPSPILGAPGPYDITISNCLDKGGLVTGARDGNGNFTKNAYDLQGRLIATMTNPVNGNPDDPNAPSFNPFDYYNGNSQNILVLSKYDDAGNLIQVIDGENQVTGWRYDGLGRQTYTLWDENRPLRRVEHSSYDGLLLRNKLDSKGQTTEFRYDLRHRLKTLVFAPEGGDGHVDNREYSYDLVGNITGTTYPNETLPRQVLRGTTQVFDKLDRLREETSAGVTHEYSYDKAGNRTLVIYGSTGLSISSGYDALNRLASCMEPQNGGGSIGGPTTYAYDLGGLVTLKVLPNSSKSFFEYDRLGRKLLESNLDSSDNLVSGFIYSREIGDYPNSYDNIGNLLAVMERYPASGVTVANRNVFNTYDKTSRLVAERRFKDQGWLSAPDFTIYYYDRANNRSAKLNGFEPLTPPSEEDEGQELDFDNIGSPKLLPYTFYQRNLYFDGPLPGVDPEVGISTKETYYYGDGNNGYNSNQLALVATPSKNVFFQYDENGDRINKAAGGVIDQTYSYDFENRLLEVFDRIEGTFNYSYDYRTRRVGRDESAASGQEDEISFSGGQSIQEYPSGSQVPSAEIIRGSDWGGGVGGVLYTIRGADYSYNGYNSRGDVVSQTDTAGNATWQASYEAFGKRHEEAGTTQGRQKANTKDEDLWGGLNEGMRYRDLEFGIFFTRDPAGFVDGPNVYTYVNQNPWTAFDPDGLRSVAGYSKPTGHVPGTGEQILMGVYKALLAPAMGPAVLAGTPVTTGKAIASQAKADYTEAGTLGVVNRFNPVAQATGGVMGVDIVNGTPLTTEQRAEGITGGVVGTASIAAGGVAVVSKLTSAAEAAGGVAAVGAKTARTIGKETAATTGAESVNAGSALRSKLSALEDAQAGASKTRMLPDGRVRYYGPETAATKSGPTRGASYVTEHNSTTGGVRSWMENYNQAGEVNRVHPKMKDGQSVNSQHYPPTAKELKR